jgi:hypothetical protein
MMDDTIRSDRLFSMRQTPLRPRGLTRELAEQVELLADGPSRSVTYSDLYDLLRDGIRNLRRLLPIRTARVAR